MTDTHESLVLPGDQYNHAVNWLNNGALGGMADDALVKITDAKGNAICTLTAKWLQALVDLPQPERQAPTWEPSRHVCGLRGFGLQAGDTCPACEASRPVVAS